MEPISRARLIPLLVLLTFFQECPNCPADEPTVWIEPVETDGLQFFVEGSADRSQRLEGSRDLRHWTPFFAQRNIPNWSHRESTNEAYQFYRLVESVPASITRHGSWKSSIELPDDSFLSDPIAGTSGDPDRFVSPTEVRFVKFAILLDHLPTVHFQDSSAYAFHYQFATERLDPFAGMSVEEFNAISLTRDGQRVVLGAVLYAPELNEYGIQLVGQDAYPREMIRLLYRAVEDSIVAPVETRGFYLPTFEQNEIALSERAWLSQHGIEVSSANRWYDGDSCYAGGWALGRLVHLSADEIDTAYREGRLRPTDILLTDGVPAEVPFVAGIITTAPATPNSHVAILAQSYHIPFVYLAGEKNREALYELASRKAEIVLRAEANYGDCQIKIIDVTAAPSAYKSEILLLKQPPELELIPIASRGEIAVSDLTEIRPEDIATVGGKAANFGFLRRVIPESSPDAMAFSFDLWTAYLNQPLPGTQTTLGREIDNRLAPFTWPPDMAALDVTLRGIRDLIKDTADFNPTQRAAILANLVGFDDHRKLRFRSSTNVEDGANFIGAGLYDSFSGCIADDTDDDEDGPSHCDPTKAGERGVFRAMRKVYASFYNLNAYVERLRHNVDESTVGMAILVHHSFPDEIEAANGVATSRLSGSPTFRLCHSTMVSQAGAISITNPGGGSLPEIVDAEAYRSTNFQGLDLHHRQRSSLLRLGEETVMNWERDYQALSDDLFDLCLAWQKHFDGINGFTLEFEYKKLTNDRLVVKQVRSVPEAEGPTSTRLALFNESRPMRVFQGEAASVMANHRLKSFWNFETSNRWIDGKIENSFITRAEVERVHGESIISETGPPSRWENHSFNVVREHGNLYFDDNWSGSNPDAGAVDWRLRIPLPHPEQFKHEPTRTLADLTVFYEAVYSRPLPDIDHNGNHITAMREAVHLEAGAPDDPPPPGSTKQIREHRSPAIDLEIGFYWPPAPPGIVAGYTAPWVGWDQTIITGLTDTPIVLEGYYSQTYRPGHHNFHEEFVFEPQLEEGMDAVILEELRAANIRMIHLWTAGGHRDRVKVIGFDGSIRDL